MAELKKCPFCGGENLYIIHDKISIKRKTFVECQDCKATAPIEAWNNRATEAERAMALKYAQSRFRHTYETMVANKMENCINWADMLDSMVAEQLKEE